ncbi:MAG: LemA family protein [Gammaproteobacteria bacterium]|nr:LemA family protein [Gammaproteobacteria bacterium]
MIVIILLVIGILVLFTIVGMYNRLIFYRDDKVKESWKAVEILLRKRANLIPKLLESVKGYLGREKSLLKEMINLRKQSLEVQHMEDRITVECMLSKSLAHLFEMAENQDDLKEDEKFIDLQKEFLTLKDDLQFSQNYYNDIVRRYNILLESFPSNLIAKLFYFEPAKFFKIDKIKFTR